MYTYIYIYIHIYIYIYIYIYIHIYVIAYWVLFLGVDCMSVHHILIVYNMSAVTSHYLYILFEFYCKMRLTPQCNTLFSSGL